MELMMHRATPTKQSPPPTLYGLSNETQLPSGFNYLPLNPLLFLHRSLIKYLLFLVLFQVYNDAGENNTNDGPAATRIIARVCSAIIRLGSKVLEQGKRFRVSSWATVDVPSNAGLAAASENVEAVSSVVGNAEDISTSAAESLNGQREGKADATEVFRFPQFDVLQSPLDHPYLDNVGQVRN